MDVFSLERVNKAGAKFDPEKAKWFQHHYLQEMDEKILISGFKDLLASKNIFPNNDVPKIVSLLKERATFINDFWEQGSFFFEGPKSYDEKAFQKAVNADTPQLLGEVSKIIQETEKFTEDVLSEKIKGWITASGIGFGKVMMPLRLALVGEMKGPEVFSIIEVLGKEESLLRIQNLIVQKP